MVLWGLDQGECSECSRKSPVTQGEPVTRSVVKAIRSQEGLDMVKAIHQAGVRLCEQDHLRGSVKFLLSVTGPVSV